MISFIGLFYDSFRPNVLIQALSELVAEKKINPKELKVQFVGANQPEDLDIKDEFGITEFIGFVPRRRAIQYLMNADALLLLLSEQRGKHVIPSKIYEYMFSGKPILALVPQESEVAKMITDTNSGFVVDFDDFNGIKSACLRFYRNWKNGEKLSNPCRQKVNQFNMKTICEKFARLLCGLT